MTNEFKYTAAAWRKAAGNQTSAAVDLELPSGMVIKALRPDLSVWMLQGRLPAAFTQLVLQARNGEDAGDAPAEITTEQIMAMGSFYHDVVIAAVIAPRLVERASSPEEISYADIPAEDIDFIFTWATRQPEAAGLSRFRGKREPAAAGADSANVRNTAQLPRRNRRSRPRA